MGFLHKTAIGIEVSHGGIGGVQIRRQAESLSLLRTTRSTLPEGCLTHTAKGPQVSLPADFVRVLREVWGSLHLSDRRIALSLPDSAGQLLMTSLNDPWKRHIEATELLKWKLGKRFGIAPDTLQLDFQLLERHENGATDLLVAFTNRELILQYEELSFEAGLQPIRIGLHTPHLLRLFEYFKAGAGQIITLYDGALGVTAQNDRRTMFCRVKQLPAGIIQSESLRRELTRSLAASRTALGGSGAGAWYLMTPDDDQVLVPLLTAAAGEPPHRFQPAAILTQDAESALSQAQLFRASAAVGAALGAI